MSRGASVGCSHWLGTFSWAEVRSRGGGSMRSLEPPPAPSLAFFDGYHIILRVLVVVFGAENIVTIKAG